MRFFDLSFWKCPAVSRLGVLGLSMLLGTSPAFAVLGEAFVGSMTTNTSTPPRSNVSSTIKKASYPLYSSHSTTLENGTVVSEFTTNNAVVFAMSWSGPTLPDLNSLLGHYFSNFKSEVAKTRNQRNIGTPLRMEADGLVLQSFGRMGNFAGQAYVPALVPAGLEIKDVLPY